MTPATAPEPSAAAQAASPLPAPQSLVPGAPSTTPTVDTRSVRRALLLTVGVLVFIGAAVTALTLSYLRQEVLDNAVNLTDGFAHLVEEQTSRTLQTVDQRLELAADSLVRLEAAGPVSAEQGRALLREQIAQLPYVLAVEVVGLDGRLRFVTDATGARAQGRADDVLRLHLREPGVNFLIGEPRMDPATGTWTMTAARPLRRGTGGQAAGLVVAIVDLAYLNRLWGGIDVGTGGAISLIRQDGLILIRSPMDPATMGRRITGLEIHTPARLASRAGTFVQASNVDGLARIFAYRRLSVQPTFTVVVGRSQALALEPWRRLAALAALGWVGGTLVISLLCVFLLRAWRQHLASETDAQRMAQRLVLATGAANVGVWDWDLRRDVWYATPAYFTMLGHAPRTGPSTSADSLENVHPEDKERVAGIIQAALASTNAPYRYEARLGHADGGWRWIRVAGSVLETDANGHATRLFGANFDITPRKQAELELTRAKEYFERLIANANAMVVGLDLEGRVTLFNHAAEIASGYTADEIRGRSIFDTLVPRDRYPAILAGFQRVSQGSMLRTTEGPLVTKGGTVRTVAWRNSEAVEDGRITGVISFGIDITERLVAEQDLQFADTELRMLNRTLRMMIECDQALVHATDERELLEQTCRILAQRGGYRMVWVGLAEHDAARTLRVAADHGATATLRESSLHWRAEGTGLGPAGTAVRTGDTTVVRDVQAPGVMTTWREAFDRTGVRSILALPLGHSVPALGVLNIYSGEAASFHAEEIRLLTDLARNLSYGIQSLRVEARHREAEQALAESERRYRQLIDTSPYAIGVMQDGRLVMINPAAVRLFGALDATELLGRRFTELVDPAFVEQSRRRFEALMSAREASPIETRFRRLDGSTVDVESSIAQFTYRDRDAAQVIALDITERKQAEAALHESRGQLQTLGRRVLAAQETERRRVAHELHDELGQSLTAMKINLQTRQRMGDRAGPELMAENMRLVEDALQQVRRLALALRPSVLDDLGLVPALRSMAEQTGQRGALRVRFSSELPDRRLASETETACFRIAQEALTNVMRYARASQVELRLAQDGEAMVLEVRDDGCGFDVAAVRARALAGSSIGVLGMQERATLIGGTLEIESRPGHGSTVRLRCRWLPADSLEGAPA